MPETLKVSVIIPTFNRAGQLSIFLDRFYSQTLPRQQFEIVIVDWGSTDDTKQVIGLHADHLPITYTEYLAEKRVPFNLSKARNIGIEACTGNILMFFDCDQLIDADFLEQHLRFHRHADHFLVAGYRDHISMQGDPYEDLRRAVSNSSFCSENWEQMQMGWHLAFGCNISIAKKWVAIGGDFDVNFRGWGMEDIEFVRRMRQVGVKVVLNKYALTQHLDHPTEKLTKKYLSWRENLAYFYQKDPQREVRAQHFVIPIHHPNSAFKYNFTYAMYRMERYSRPSPVDYRVLTLCYVHAPDIVSQDELYKAIVELADQKNQTLVIFFEEMSSLNKMNWRMDILLQDLERDPSKPILYHQFEHAATSAVVNQYLSNHHVTIYL